MKRVLLIILPLLIYPSLSYAKIETVKIYADDSDAFVTTQPYPGSWNTQRYDVQGRFSNNNGVPSYGAGYARVFSGAFYTPTRYLSIDRAFLSFDTTIIPEYAEIKDVRLSLYVEDASDDYNDPYGYIAILQGRQDSPTSLNPNDIDNCGESIDGATLGSERIDITDVEIGSPLKITLNESGKSWLNLDGFTKLCLREGHDIENRETQQNIYTGTWKSSFITFATSEVQGVEKDPYLEVTYEVPDSEIEYISNTLVVYGDLSDTIMVTPPESTWSKSHDSLEGYLIDEDWEYMESFVRSNNNQEYVIYRSFFNFDTSPLPDDAVITDVNFNAYVYRVHNDGDPSYAYMGVYQGVQESITNISLSDVTRCGDALTNPTSGGDTVKLTDIMAGSYQKFELNQDGMSWISKDGFSSLCLRNGHDVENQPISGGPFTYSGIRMHSADYVDRSTDPYLTITYKVPKPKNEYPLYTQGTSTYPSYEETVSWANEKMLCGTIGECGCAITSGVMAGRNAGITTDVLGNDVNPKNINEYLKAVGGYTTDGSVWWLAMQSYLGEFIDGRLASRFKYEGKFEGPSTMSTADEYLAETGKYAVLAFKKRDGHFVWLPEKTEMEYLVRDPNWYLTETANDPTGDKINDYNDSFDSVRVYEVLDEPEFYTGDKVEAYIKGTAQLLYKSLTGDRVGYVDGATVIDLENSSYGEAEIIKIDGVSSDGFPRKHLLVYEAGNEFTIDVIGTDRGEYEMEFFTISETGEITTFSMSGQTIPGVTTTWSFNLETGEAVEQPISYEQFVSILEKIMVGYTDQQRKFFMKWAEKIYADMEEKTVSQALQSIEVYKKLLVAKKIESPVLSSVLNLLAEGVKKE